MIGDLYVVIFMIVIFGLTLYLTRDKKHGKRDVKTV